MEDYGSKTKQLLKNRIKDIQQAYREINQDIAPYAQDYIQPQIYKVQDIEDSMNTNFGNISNIQMPYEIRNYNDYEEEDNEKEIEEQETFCSYVLYFILILILLGYIGFYLAKERIVSVEIMNGITLGLLTGMIMINLLWSSIKN
jgi:hypothetical protein